MRYIIEFFFNGDCIDKKEFNSPFLCCEPGTRLFYEFEKVEYSERYGQWWIVSDVKHLMFKSSANLQVVQYFCQPDPEQGR